MIARFAVVAAVVVGAAALQALLVLGDPVPSLDPLFLLRFLGSAVVVVAWAWGLVAVITPAAPGRRSLTLTAVALIVVATGCAALLTELLVGPVLLAGLIMLPAIARGDRAATGWRVFARRPVVASLWVILTLVLVAVCAVASLLLGLFITGAAGAGLTWIVYGAAAALAVWGWAHPVARDRSAVNG